MVEWNLDMGGPTAIQMPPAPATTAAGEVRGEVLRFTEKLGPNFGPLTFRRFRHLLSPGRLSPGRLPPGGEDTTGFGVLAGETPVGLALVFCPP
jgi:hypothetical protein